jgi:hypothetical protein
MDRQLIGGEDSCYGCTGEIWKERLEVRQCKHKIRHCKQNIVRQKNYKKKEIANVDCKQFDETDSGTHHIGMYSAGKRTVHTET